MKLAMTINYSGDFHADVRPDPGAREGRARPRVGRRGVLLRRHQPGRLPRRQDRRSRSAPASSTCSRARPRPIAQTAAGCDFVSDGRFILGLGASGPQVIEGFHGVPYEHADAAHPRVHRGVPDGRGGASRSSTTARPCRSRCPPGRAPGSGKPLKLINHPKRADIPVFWASLMGKSVADTARARRRLAADLLRPREVPATCGATTCSAGLADRDPSLGPLQISAGGMVAIGDEYAGDGADRVLDMARPTHALYVGGMGARDKNFYNTIAKKYGYVDEATEIQDLYLSGRKEEAAAAVPRELLANTNLVGPESHVAERIAAYKEAGVTHLSGRSRSAPNPVKTIETTPRPSRERSSELWRLDDVGVRHCDRRLGGRTGSERQTRPRSHQRLRAQATASVARAAAAQLHVRSVTISTSSPSVSPRIVLDPLVGVGELGRASPPRRPGRRSSRRPASQRLRLAPGPARCSPRRRVDDHAVGSAEGDREHRDTGRRRRPRRPPRSSPRTSSRRR